MRLSAYLPARLRVRLHAAGVALDDLRRGFRGPEQPLFRGITTPSRPPTTAPAARARVAPARSGRRARRPAPPEISLEERQRRARARVARRAARLEQTRHDWPTPPRGASHRVAYRRSGLTLDVADDRSLLEAGVTGGAAMRFSCTMGGCGSCRVRLISGEVESVQPNCLTEQERAAGYVLPCVSRPLSAVELDA